MHKIYWASRFTLYSNLCFLKLIHQTHSPRFHASVFLLYLITFFFSNSHYSKKKCFWWENSSYFLLLIISAVSVSKLPLIQAKVSSVKITITLEIMEATLSLRFFDFLSTMIIILWLKSHITYGYKHLLLSLSRYL